MIGIPQQDSFDFAAPTARDTDPETSHMAAPRDMNQVRTHRMKALAALVAAGCDGLNDFELSAAVGVPQTSIGVRRKSLERNGLVERGFVIDPESLKLCPSYRPSPTGARSIVWVATAAGRCYLEEHQT